jgi:hypothetical protein
LSFWSRSSSTLTNFEVIKKISFLTSGSERDYLKNTQALSAMRKSHATKPIAFDERTQ